MHVVINHELCCVFGLGIELKVHLSPQFNYIIISLSTTPQLLSYTVVVSSDMIIEDLMFAHRNLFICDNELKAQLKAYVGGEASI